MILASLFSAAAVLWAAAIVAAIGCPTYPSERYQLIGGSIVIGAFAASAATAVAAAFRFLA